MSQSGVSVPSQIRSWDSKSGPLNQKSDVQPLEPEKHAQLAEASDNTRSSGTPLLHSISSLFKNIFGFQYILTESYSNVLYSSPKLNPIVNIYAQQEFQHGILRPGEKNLIFMQFYQTFGGILVCIRTKKKVTLTYHMLF